MKKQLLAITAIVLISLLAACNDDDDTKVEEEDVMVPVETIEAVKEDFVIHKSIYGRVEPAQSTPIIAQLPGEIDALEVKNGDQVEKDDHIATLKTEAGLQNIKASRAGEVAELRAEEGDMATTEEPLAILIDIDDMKVQLTVTSTVRSLMKLDDTVTTLIDGDEYKVEITSIGKIPDDTGLYPIEGIVDNKDKKLLPGMVAKVTIPQNKVKDAIVLPTEAIVEESDGTFIYRIEDNQAIKTEITVKESQSDTSAVEGDIKKGDQIVTNGQLTLTDDSKVEVVKEGNKS